MAFTFAPPPFREAFDSEEGGTRRPWVDWLTSLTQTVTDSPTKFATVALSGQAASIGATDIGTGTAGLYRVTYCVRITTAAVTSSSLTVTIGWTTGSVACSLSGAALTGNTTATVQTGTVLLRSDANAPVSYSTTYASNGAGQMKYQMDVVMESVAL